MLLLRNVVAAIGVGLVRHEAAHQADGGSCSYTSGPTWQLPPRCSNVRLDQLSMIKSPTYANGNQNTSYWLGCALILLVKLVVLYFDHLPMFFLGDSEVYLNTAATGNIPINRSYTYGYLIGAITFATKSLTTLVIMQVLASTVTAILLVHLLIHYFHTRLWIAWLFGLIFAVEPLQLLYERYVMAEAFALLILALYVMCCFEYLRRPRFTVLALVHLAGIALLSLRLSYLPIVLANVIALPIIATFGYSGRRATFLLAHVVAAVIIAATLHSSYRMMTGWLADKSPAYFYSDGFFLAASWAPLIQAEDFPDRAIADSVFPKISNLADVGGRPTQLWSETGLIHQLELLMPNRLEANLMASSIAFNIIKRDPLGVLGLAGTTFLGYLNKDLIVEGIFIDQGHYPGLTESMKNNLATNFRLTNAERLPQTKTLTKKYHKSAVGWYMALPILPFLWVIGFLIDFQRPQRLLWLNFGFLSTAYLFIISTFAIEVVVRYLHPLAWFSTLMIAVLVDRSRQTIFHSQRAEIAISSDRQRC